MKKLLLLVALTSSASAPAVAADVGNLIDGAFDAASRIERREIAKSFLQKLEKLSVFIPQPRPSEKAWLEGEKNEINKLSDVSAKNARLRSFYQSPELHQSKLKSHLEDARNALECVLETDINIRREMHCWAIASSTLLHQDVVDDAIQVLLRHGRLPKNIVKEADLMSKDVGYGFFYTWYSRGIIEYIVIPYLAGKIKE